MGDVVVKEFGSSREFLATIEKKGQDNDFVGSIKKHLESDLAREFDFRRVEVVGSKISKELTKSGSILCCFSFIFDAHLYLDKI